MKKLLIIVGLSFCANLYAQNQDDLLRYSQTNVLGTARSQAVGGAFGALGADFSSTQINPAGLALYRRNEVHLSAGVTSESANTNYLGSSNDDRRTNFNIPSLGIVLTKVFNEMGNDVEEGLTSITFAAGMNRVNSFQQNISYTGINTQSSVLDYYVQQANGYKPSSFENDRSFANYPAAMAWNTYLLGIDNNYPDSTHYNSWVTGNSAYRLQQGTQISNTGAMYEYNVSAGANLGNWVYFGAGLVITQVYRESKNTFTETVKDNSVDTYSSSTLVQNVNTHGSGASGRFGLIVRPIDFLRFGFSAQTSSRLNLRDDYSNTLTANYTNGQSFTQNGPLDFIEYQVITPAKYTASAALTVSEFGFISVDVDMVDYSKMRIKSDAMDNATISEINTQVTDLYTKAYNVRIGAEIKFADIYRLRGGYVQYGSPFRDGATSIKKSDLTRYGISGGLGVIVDRFFYDLTAVYTYGNNYYTPYNLTDQSKTFTAKSEFANLNFVLTAGYRF